MTITRLAQFTAETRITTDFAYYAFPPAISSAQAKTGSYAYDYGFQTGAWGLAAPVAQTAIRMGFWFYMADTTIADTTLLYQAGHGIGFSAGTSRIYLRIDSSDGEITLRRAATSSTGGDTTLATASIPAQFGTTGTWFHVGITHKVDDTDGFLSLYVDGQQILTYTGDTRPSFWNGSAVEYDDSLLYILGPGANSISGAPGFQSAYLDDMYIDSIVGEADGIVPARRFLMVLPTAAGEDEAWTPEPAGDNYANVDDNPHDGDNSYNKALAADLRDTFEVGNITVPTDHVIVAVIPTVFAKRLDSEADNALSVHAWDGVQYEDSADLDLAMSYNTPVFARFTTQPDGSAWTETDFNAMEFGYRSRGTF